MVDSVPAFGHYEFMRYRVIIEQDEDGVFVVECPTLPGCISQGATRDEAVVNIKDAIEGYIASLEKHGEAVPLPLRSWPARFRRVRV
jgi:antitoxin HicB